MYRRIRYGIGGRHPAVRPKGAAVSVDGYLHGCIWSDISEHFSGKLLEVPVGTGILTMPVYQTMPEADITCLDCMFIKR